MPPHDPEEIGIQAAQSKPLSRRSFLTAALLAGVAPSVLVGCASSNGGKTGGLIPAPTNPVQWPLSSKNKPIKPGLRPQRGSTLRVYNYADYLGPQVIKDFESTYGLDISVST